MRSESPEEERQDVTDLLHVRPNTLSHFKRIDGPWSWIMCALLMICSLLGYGCVTSYGILFPSILKELKSSKAITAIPGSLSLANAGLLGVVIGRLFDVIGCHKTMLMGGLLCATGLIASSFAPNITVLIATFGFLLGTGCCAVYFATIVGVPIYFHKYKFEATSIVSVGPGSGLFIMSPVVQHVNKALGWRTSMLCMAGFSIVPCLVALLIRSKPLEDHDVEEKDEEEQHTNRRSCRISNLVYCSAFKIRLFLLTTIVTMVVSLGHVMTFVHLAKISEDMNIPSDLSSWLYLIIGLCSTLSRLLVGKFGKSGPLSLQRIFVLGTFILAIGNLYLPSVPKYYALVVYSIGYGIGEGFIFTTSISIVLECLPNEKRGSGFGLFQFFICISFVVGPILSGFIADVTGTYTYAFYVAGSLETVVGCLAGFLFHFIHLPMKDTSDMEPLGTELIIIEKETVL